MTWTPQDLLVETVAGIEIEDFPELAEETATLVDLYREARPRGLRVQPGIVAHHRATRLMVLNTMAAQLKHMAADMLRQALDNGDLELLADGKALLLQGGAIDFEAGTVDTGARVYEGVQIRRKESASDFLAAKAATRTPDAVLVDVLERDPSLFSYDTQAERVVANVTHAELLALCAETAPALFSIKLNTFRGWLRTHGNNTKYRLNDTIVAFYTRNKKEPGRVQVNWRKRPPSRG